MGKDYGSSGMMSWDYVTQQPVWQTAVNPKASYLFSDDYAKGLSNISGFKGIDAGTEAAIATAAGVKVPEMPKFETGVELPKPDSATSGFPFMDENGLFGMNKDQWSTIGDAAGLAGTAYGIYSNLWGNKADLFKEQLGMLKDQRAYNQKMIADRDKYKANIGSGLAAAFTKDK